MASVAQHLADNPHYSQINDSTIKPSQSQLCSSRVPHLDHADGCHIIENPYDAPIPPRNAETSVNELELDKCYSRLDRVIPTSLVQPCTDARASKCSEIVSSGIEQAGQPELLDTSASHVETPPSLEEDGTKDEHPYHILEEPKDGETSTDSWSSNSYRSIEVPKEDRNSLDGQHGSSPTSDVRYQTSDSFKIYDVSKNPYDHLQSQDTINTEVVKYRNLEQYLEPISLKQTSPHGNGTVNTNSNHASATFKYSGDYDRDPSYMERLQQAGAKMQPSHYQTLVQTTMNPADDYTKLQVL